MEIIKKTALTASLFIALALIIVAAKLATEGVENIIVIAFMEIIHWILAIPMMIIGEKIWNKKTPPTNYN